MLYTSLSVAGPGVCCVGGWIVLIWVDASRKIH